MSKDVLGNTDLSVVYLPGVSAVVTTDKPKYPTAPQQKVDGSGKIVPWGDTNLFPQEVWALAEKTTIPTLIKKMTEGLYGRVIYGKEQIDDAGNAKFVRQINPDIEAWMKRTNVKRYLLEAAHDLFAFGNFFPEIILSNDRKKITGITAQEAMYCRFERHNTNGISPNVYINANWDNGGTEDDSLKVPVLDPYYDPVGNLMTASGFKFIYPSSFPSPGKSYYQVAAWDSVRKNGFLEIAAMIPSWKKTLMKQQISIKYHIEVPNEYWSAKYTDWDAKSAAEKINTKQQELADLNSILTGEKNAGRSIMTASIFSTQGNERVGWKIKQLDEKFADGKYIEDMQNAFDHLLFAIGIDGTLVGNSPGKGMGAGSGSDKRVAFETFIIMNQANEDLLLEPLNNVIAPYNGWDVEFRIDRKIVTTLDAGSSTKKVA
jgi:hypothetical protein